jgi:indole-3-glycerol phosphate synthase
MSTFLERILEEKKREVENLYSKNIHFQFKKQIENHVHPVRAAFTAAIAAPGKLSVIAEIKRASPSKGIINEQFDILERAVAYEAGGAAAISVLTDAAYFHGSISDLKAVCQKTNLPILRKDFIIDSIQVEESLLAGASAILLIAAAMSRDKLAGLSTYAKGIGLEVLIEVHNQNEVETALFAKPSVLGINNRDLHTFEVSFKTSLDILRTMPRVCPVISESGFLSIADVKEVACHGVDGILVGESLMRENSLPQLQKTITEYSACVFAPTESRCKA